MLYQQNIDGCLAESIGATGVDRQAFEKSLGKVAAGIERLKDAYASDTLPLLKISQSTEDIDAAAAALAALSEGARSILFFGTGGSGLGGQTLAQVSGWNIPGGANVYDRSRPRTRFYDNLDPLTQLGTLDEVDLASTRFVIISKSGGTTETLAQAITALSAVQDAGLGEAIPNMFLGITEPDTNDRKNGLRDLFEAHAIPLLDHPIGIGGRFSCLTNVGLLPALARGMKAHDIRKGADEVVQQLCAATGPQECPPAVGAAIALAAAENQSIRSVVMMPYSDRLAHFASWFVQLWAESLGKGGHGTTPIATLGPRDQHSQLQLFMDGPRDFLFTVLRIANAGTGPEINADMAGRAGASYMAGKTIGDIVNAQSHAIVAALQQAGRPVRTVDVATLGERHIGALLMHFMLETILTGYALEIDPFDQPAVELAKKLTRENLSTA
ncbi:MAG: glucose-6-phosphate isomerase [Alphaproteobacteria bacterium]|nr:glucose-6-phosphate isomerase [Alphaproteobacteria bacterium]